MEEIPVKMFVSPSVAVSVHENVQPEVMPGGKDDLKFNVAESPVLVAFKTDKLMSSNSNSTWNPAASFSPSTLETG